MCGPFDIIPSLSLVSKSIFKKPFISSLVYWKIGSLKTPRGQLPQPLFHLPPRCHFVAVAIAATGDVVDENNRPGPAGEDGKKETDLDTSLATWEPLR